MHQKFVCFLLLLFFLFVCCFYCFYLFVVVFLGDIIDTMTEYVSTVCMGNLKELIIVQLIVLEFLGD